MLGRDIANAAAAAGHELTALGRAELDITDVGAVEAAMLQTRPDAVVNCAAWTDVDGAEAQAEQAFAVNGPGAGNVARAAVAAGAWTVHVSSDYVFAGDKRSPYLESDPTEPKSQYGRGKLAGELAVAEVAPEAHTIVRSSWLFGAGGPCFPATILRIASERDQITVVDDQVGCPTFTGHLASAVIALAHDQIPGILHVAGGGDCSWYDFSREIVSRAGRENVTGEVRSGVNVHASQHCVANKAPNPAKHRMLFATGKHTRRLLLPGDEVHPGRTGKIFPEPGEVPERYRPVLEWARARYEGGGTTPVHEAGANRVQSEPSGRIEALFELWGLGKEYLEGVDPDEYVRKLREGWE